MVPRITLLGLPLALLLDLGASPAEAKDTADAEALGQASGQPFEQDGGARPRLGIDLECDGQPRPRCAPGFAGVACDLPCDRLIQTCTIEQVCHGWGAAAGVTAIGAHLFPWSPPPAEPQAAASIAEALRTFIVRHPRELGLRAGIAADDLGLEPAANFRSTAGALQIFRFDQRYRGLPIFGGDGLITLVTDPSGAIAIRGMVVDGRQEYAHRGNNDSVDAVTAESSIVAYAQAFSGVAVADLEVGELRRLAVPRQASVGWAATVRRGALPVATIVVAAGSESGSGALPLLYLDDHRLADLEDEVPLTLRSQDLGSTLSGGSLATTTVTQLRDGSPLVGSSSEGRYLLATPRLVGLDASEHPNLNIELDPLSAPTPGFTAEPGDPRFDTQRAYHLTAELYAFTDRFMRGRWESARPLFHAEESLFAPGEFFPRGLVFTRAQNGCPAGAPACAVLAPRNVLLGENPAYYHPSMNHPLAPPFEPIGAIIYRNELTSVATIAHEFGHFIDFFAKPGALYLGLGCYGNDACEPSCREDSTDEASPLSETWANLAALWFLRSLATEGDDPASCDLVQGVVRGDNRAPHSAACRAQGEAYAHLLRADDPGCPESALCDKPSAPGLEQGGDGVFRPTGLCARSPGYRTNSLTQALWELLHGESCATAPPFTCAPLPHLQAATSPPEEVVGEALLYALRLSGGTYRSFANDLVTYLACNHGEAVYAEVNAVLCHHGVRPCEAPAPALCELCGNGIREGGEACDGGDLGGHTCVDLGYVGGSLACGPGCTLDPAGCLPADTDTDTDTTMPGDEPTDPGAASATTGGVADEPGCACQAPAGGFSRAPVAGLLGLLGAFFFGRRRRYRGRQAAATTAEAGLLVLALGVLSGGATACHGGPTATTGEPITTTTAETDTDTDTTDAVPAEPDPRFFRTFHTDSVYVGWSNELAPEDELSIAPFALITVSPDGTMEYEVYQCGDLLTHAYTYRWTYVAAQKTLDIVPDGMEETLPGNWLPPLTSMQLTPDPVCEGNLRVAMTNVDGATIAVGYRPGRVCAEVSDPERCRFTIAWCDEGEPGPLCPAP